MAAVYRLVTQAPQDFLVQYPGPLKFTVALKDTASRMWANPLVFPAYVALLSAALLLFQVITTSRRFKNLWARLTSADTLHNQDEPSPPSRNDTDIANDLSEHVKLNGGPVIFGFQLLRLLACAALLTLYLYSAWIDEESILHLTHLGNKGKRGRKRKDKDRVGPSDQEWIDMIAAMTSFYAVSLAAFIVSSAPKWAKIVTRHLNTVLLSSLGVYLYRDVYPLITFDGVPMDAAQGWVIWAKISTLVLTGIVITITIPRRYTPADPEDPSSTPNPEQTASLLSLVTYSFLDPVISLANKIPTLPSELLPSLPDYDRAKYLKAQSFPHLDVFASSHTRHIFFGLMRVFRKDYIILAIMVVIQVLAGFASPLGIKNLLHYLETNGEDSTIRPWFWITWLFLGPFTMSMALQYYIYIATHLLVKTECIITQLVFEHSLRIRVKAEATDGKTIEPVNPSTPDSASVTETQGYSSESETLHSQHATEPTVVAESTGSKVSDSSGDSTSAKKPSKSDDEGSSNAQNLIGKINNLVTTDLNNIGDSRDFLYVIIYIPLQITLCIIFLYKVLGWSSFVGLAVMVILFPLPGYVAKVVQDVQVARLKKTDARVQVVSETMNVLRMIKLFGWEKKTSERIAEKREEELLYIWRRQVLDLINGSLTFVIPVLTMITTYATLQLTASIVFSSMTVFDMLRDQMHVVFYYVNQSITGKVSLDRVNDFLHNTELLDEFTERKEPTIVPPNLVGKSDIIGFHEASFAWSSDTNGSLTPSKRKFMLRIENELVFPQGQLNLVVGPTGSGKTSLLMALLGEMHYVPMAPDSWFNLPRSQGIAYAAQESWVQNETIKENILFGSPYDEERYNKVIYQCSLTRDLGLFKAGDQTEVGEKGLTLSGGQKARITLARAIYSPAKILLLDDVLAALDVHTAKWIVDKCFKGDLVKGRTVILVTHNVALASSVAQFAVSLGGDGKVLTQGSISEALKANKELVEELKADEEHIKKADEEVDEQVDTPEAPDGKLIVAEEVEEGHVSWSALSMFLSSMGGYFFFLVYLSGLLLTEGCLAIQTWFLGYWASQYATHPPAEVSVLRYLGSYSLLLLLAVTSYAIAQIIYIFGAISASRTLHRLLVQSVLGTTLRWLDTTPISRVIARCTQDIRAVDGPLAQGLWYLSEMTLSMLVKFAAVVYLTPAFLLPGIVVAVLGGWLGQIYIKAQLSVKREMSNAKAPVLGHFGAAIAGLTSLRAYGAQKTFVEQSMTRIDRYTKSARTFYNLNRWICVRIDLLGGMFASGLGWYLIYFQDYGASNTGFSLNMAVGFSGMILWWIRVLNDFEVQGNSLERIQGYIDIEQEPTSTESGVPPAYWPADGSLHVENLTARYSPDGPEVLHGISFDVQSGERIGVVGRTGSGKSSLTLSLLRCIFMEGKVVYAGRDTSTVNLEALRSNITIIPQVPELLSGSLRQNLDPFDQYDDATLNDALRSAGLFSLQEEVDEGKITLDSSISSGGGNLSVGQRQIIALARAIIRGSKLLILDEATSAIDHKTDAIIQSSMRNELGKDVTILTVAHRLQTIMDADKIMVLDAGNIVEFDKPSELLKDPLSRLRGLVEESGDKETLLSMAGAADP